MIEMYEVNGYNIAVIDCYDSESIDIESIDWSSVNDGDIVKKVNGDPLGTVSIGKEGYITVKGE